MKIDTFNQIIEEQLSTCKSILCQKGLEYTPDAMAETSADRLAAFKKAAVIIEGTPKEALLGMLSKHLVSISDMCVDGKEYSVERWTEKITDSINYLLILRAMIDEERRHKDEQN